MEPRTGSSDADSICFVRGLPRWALTGLVALGVALFVSGCSLGDDEERPDEATIAFSAQPDSLDPAMSYSLEAAPILWAAYTSPLTYRHADGAVGAQLVPGLARKMPAVLDDGRVYRFRFRVGLRYSDGSALRASDFEHALKRTLFLSAPGGQRLLGIVGAEEYAHAHKENADLAGVTTDNATGLVTVRLEHPDGTFPYALAGAFAAPVPATTPFRRLTTRPPLGVGPFRFADVDPGQDIVLARNEDAPELPTVPRPALRRITIKIMPSLRRETLEISRGNLDFMFDPPPTELRAQMRREHAGRFEEFVSNSTFYFWLNSSIPPFNNPALRRAVHLGLNKPALARLYGGGLEPTCNFLPPLMPGYREFMPCPFGSPETGGDVAKARAIVHREGALGTKVHVWGNSLEPTREVMEAFADQLDRIGLDPELEIIAPSVYFQVIGEENPELQAGFSSWFQEFPHPASFLAAVRGDLIVDEGNYNFSRTDEPALTAAIKRLQEQPGLGAAVRRRWARLDRQVVRDAGVIPYGHLRYVTFMSERMDFERCSPNHPVYLTDFSRFCLH
jgi:peptide/nickel transport system substrate-binding protein